MKIIKIDAIALRNIKTTARRRLEKRSIAVVIVIRRNKGMIMKIKAEEWNREPSITHRYGEKRFCSFISINDRTINPIAIVCRYLSRKTVQIEC